MAGFFYKGILLQQRKEPALSRNLHDFINADTLGLHMDCLPVANPDKMSHSEIIHYAKLANIIDERDGEPLATKLKMARKQNVRLVVVDAVDDEPYISSQLNPLMKNQELAEQGLAFCQQACNAKQAYFTVYKNLTDLDIRIPRNIGKYTVMRLHGRYPAEYQASQQYSNQENVLVIGSGAVIHLARAILIRKPQTTTFITVAGDCVGLSANLEVSLGMTVTQVLERCGLIDDPYRVVVGGSMTGVSVLDTDKTIVTPTTRAILAFRQNIKTLGLSCVGCARCVHVCPEGLNPYYLYKSITQNRFDVFHNLDARMCVGCGTCSYMCPAKLDLSATIFQGAAVSRPHVSAMHKTAYLDKKRDKADYQRFLDDYLLGKAISSHRVIRWKVFYQLRNVCKNDLHDYLASQRQGKVELKQAQSVCLQALRLADSAAAAAKQTLQATIENAERLEKTEKSALNKCVKVMEKEMHQAQIASSMAEAAAQQNLLAVLEQQKQLLYKITKATNAKAKSLEATASQTNMQEIRQEQDRLLHQAQERQMDACARAQGSAARAVDLDREALNHAKVLCQTKIDSHRQAFAQVQQTVKQQKEDAMQCYLAAQELCLKTKEEATLTFEQSRRKIFVELKQHAMQWSQIVRTQAPDLFELLCQEDTTLNVARERALVSALASAQADAAVTGRAMRSNDFRPPIRLEKCERELLLSRNLLALETVEISKLQSSQNTHDFLLTWVRAHGLEDQAASQNAFGEEVLV